MNELNTIGLVVGSTNGLAGDQVTVPIQVNQFTNIGSFQFSLHWDPAAAAYVGVEQLGLAGISFGTDGSNNGSLTVSWDDPAGLSQSLPDQSTLFAVRFSLTPSPITPSRIWIDGTPTPIEASDSDFSLVQVTALAGQLTKGADTLAASLVDDGSLPELGINVDSSGCISLSWAVIPGKTYRLEYTSDFSANVWSDLGVQVIGKSSKALLADAPGPFRQRFYRVVRID